MTDIVVPPSVAPTPSQVATLYAIYDQTSRKVIQFTSSLDAQDHSAHPYSAIVALAIPPTGSDVGYMIDDNLQPAPYQPTIQDSRQSASAKAQAHFDALIAANFSYAGTAFQIDPGSQTQIAAMGIMALGSITDPADSPWPAGFYWVGADNSHVPMDAPAMYAFGRAVAGYVSACVLRLRAIKDLVAGAADPATLDAIDVTAGYPPASA